MIALERGDYKKNNVIIYLPKFSTLREKLKESFGEIGFLKEASMDSVKFKVGTAQQKHEKRK